MTWADLDSRPAVPGFSNPFCLKRIEREWDREKKGKDSQMADMGGRKRDRAWNEKRRKGREEARAGGTCTHPTFRDRHARTVSSKPIWATP